MSAPLKIAVVGSVDSELADHLAALPGPPVVRSFGDLYATFDELRTFSPAALIVDAPTLDDAAHGALRVVGGALPETLVVLLSDREHEVAATAAAERFGGRVLVEPFGVRELAELLALAGDPRASEPASTFRELCRGIADEINNPLLFAAGHVQLLQTMLDARCDADRIEQLRQIDDALGRIRATVEKLSILDRTSDLRTVDEAVAIPALVRASAEAAAPAMRIHVDDGAALCVVGDAERLATAFRRFATVGAALAQLADDADLIVGSSPEGVRIRLELRGLRVDDWRLPRAFEPYFVNRILRGSGFGLDLFLVAAVVHAHGGRAIARRRDDGTVLLDLLLPEAPGPR